MHRDPLVAAVSSFHPVLDGRKYPGFYLYGQDLVVPQFFPGPFAFLGFGSLVGGTWGSLFVVPVMGALAVGVAYAGVSSSDGGRDCSAPPCSGAATPSCGGPATRRAR